MVGYWDQGIPGSHQLPFRYNLDLPNMIFIFLISYRFIMLQMLWGRVARPKKQIANKHQQSTLILENC